MSQKQQNNGGYIKLCIGQNAFAEILLIVINEEMFNVDRETHCFATKAYARQLAYSGTLASLTGLGGLGGYSSAESQNEKSNALFPIFLIYFPQLVTSHLPPHLALHFHHAIQHFASIFVSKLLWDLILFGLNDS